MQNNNPLEHPFNDNEGFREAMEDFIVLRKKLKKPATDRAIRNLVKKVIDLSDGNLTKAIRIIDQSITNCWLDFYKLREDYNEPTFTRPRQEL